MSSSSSSKRTYAEMLDNDNGNGNDELEDGEELEVTDLVPPPPPPVLRLVVYHSSAGASADLLPAHQTLAIITETTSIGRDRSYDPRIRLKSLEVSKTHATLYYNEQDGEWCILDNASTHGTFVRKEGEQTYTRLSDKGATSLPRVLKHLDTLKIANQRFTVHLHPDIVCEGCMELEDGSNLVPLMAVERPKVQNIPSSDQQQTRTKDEKRKDYKSDMKSLRANLLSRPIASGSGSSSRPVTREVSPAAEEHTIDDAAAPVQYIDRAKLRRATYGASQPLSDLQPSRSLPVLSAKASAPVEPTYGPGQALFAKMSGSTQDQSEWDRKMGSIIEVKITDRKGAGLGSGTMRTGVEQVASQSSDWRGAARDRRWQDAQRH